MLTSVLAGLSILMVGDSHLIEPAYLITTLHDDLTKNGAVVHSIGVCGSNPGGWVKATPSDCGGAERRGNGKVEVHSNMQTRPITELIAEEKPNLVIVIMGDTMAAYDKGSFPKTWAWQSTTQLTKAIAGTNTQCIWIGPTWGTEGGKYNKTYARVRQVSNFLNSNVAPCAYIDSLKLSKPGEWATVDGTHLTETGYQAWGKALSQAIVETIKSEDGGNAKASKRP